jgi:ATP-dependent DNA ligase
VGFDGRLPVMPPVEPMLARGTDRLPEGDFVHEPKWDGFRALVFRDGAALYVQSRDGKPLLRYFPELQAPLCASLPERVVVDGEIVLPGPRGLDFGALQMRLHPAKSRIDKLAAELPARVVLFDLLALGDLDLTAVGFAERRQRLADVLQPCPGVHLTPATSDPAVAVDWFARFEGAGLDGVVSKAVDLPYSPGARAMFKTKRQRSIDAVVCGFRWHARGGGVGSLVLGLWDGSDLRPIGVASSFSAKLRASLAEDLEPLRAGGWDGHPWSGWTGQPEAARSRWSADRDLAFEPVRVERVVEVTCNQVDGGRLRHPAHFVRWRPDREPSGCLADQLVVSPPDELSSLLV